MIVCKQQYERKMIIDVLSSECNMFLNKNKGNNKINELRTILQRESPNS